jgi:hypothetical protein
MVAVKHSDDDAKEAGNFGHERLPFSKQLYTP